jgi:peptidoglycan/xylan/chitin deacetylase (PgdA/CDA1 family)
MRPPLAGALLAAAAVAAGCGGDGRPAAGPTTAAPVTTASTAPAQSTPTPTAAPRPIALPARPRIARAIAVQSGRTAGREVALTFDADMTPGMRDRIRAGSAPEQVDRELIDTLRRTRTPATLFLTGMWAQRYPADARDLAADPLFEIANHTWDHRAWTSDCYHLPAVGDAAGKRAEVEKTALILRRLTGRTPFWFRFPGLCHRREDLRIVARAGEEAADGIASGDAFQSDPGVIVRVVLAQVKPGTIVVMHMMGPPNAPSTAAALRQLIPELRSRGYRLVTLSRLVAR